ncbi:MAG: IS4 family transposase [Polyangiales bacterium]
MDDARAWARDEFGDLGLRDGRLDYRVGCMAARAAQNPDGLISTVFPVAKERQAAYGVLSNSRVPSEALIAATARATAQRCAGSRYVYVVIDGTSASLSDHAKTKELGSIGARCFGARGLKAVDVLAVDPRGVPLGMLGLKFWSRGAKRSGQRFVRRRDGKTEMAEHWLPTLEDSVQQLTTHAPGVQPWIVADRECDDSRFIRAAVQHGGYFTIRVAQNRIVETTKGRRSKLLSLVRKGRLAARRVVQLPATATRRARTAMLEVRVSQMKVLLPLHDNAHSRQPVVATVVWLREVGRRKDRVSWTLLTNAPVTTEDEIAAVVASYRARWRIEEFHRAWKAGACDLESTQLRSREAIAKWATILGAVAARAERLKHLSRTEPDAPATIELTDTEIVALITLKRREKTSVEVVPDGVPTIAQATLWIADIGGYAGHYKKGRRPGTTTIARGLERLAMWTEAVATFVPAKEIRRRLR